MYTSLCQLIVIWGLSLVLVAVNHVAVSILFLEDITSISLMHRRGVQAYTMTILHVEKLRLPPQSSLIIS